MCMYVYDMSLLVQLGSNEGASGVNTVASYIQDNNIPLTFVAMLFAHFLSMVIDRLTYIPYWMH